MIERQRHITELPFWAGFDSWEPVTLESKDIYQKTDYNRWRIRHRFQRNANGQPISYEIVPGTPDQPDGIFSTGDFFVHRRAGFSEQLGAEVGNTDAFLIDGYGTPLPWPASLLDIGSPLDTDDVILWHVLREHHCTASLGEEQLTLPYHFSHFTIRPRDFLDGTPTGLYATDPPSP